MFTRLGTILVLSVLIPATSLADEAKKVSGRVLDETGRPAVGAGVSAFWGANGLSWEQFDAIPDTEVEKRWRNEGKMEPWGSVRVVTDAEGRFSIPAPERMKTLMIYDRERRHGAVALFDPKHLEAPIEIRLTPLVRIFGTIRLSGLEGPLKFT